MSGGFTKIFIMKNKSIFYVIGGLFTVLGGYFAYDLIKGNQIKQKTQPDKQETTGSANVGSEETTSGSKKESNDSYPLKVGSYGAKVHVLQQALNALGASLQIDGRFGQNTYNAVQNISGGFGGLNFLCGIDYGCKVTYNNWESIVDKAKEKGFDVNQAWTNAKKTWLL